MRILYLNEREKIFTKGQALAHARENEEEEEQKKIGRNLSIVSDAL